MKKVVDFWQEFGQRNFLPFIHRSRWFSGKIECTNKLTVRSALQWSTHLSYLLIVEVECNEEESELYFIPVSLVPRMTNNIPENALIVESIQWNGEIYSLIDAIHDESFRQAIFRYFCEGTNNESLSVVRFHHIDEPYRSSRILSTDSTNSLLVLNEKYLFKFYRKSSTDKNIEIEMLTFIGKSDHFSKHIPTCFGAISECHEQLTIPLIMVEKFISNASDCWSIMTRCLDGPPSPQILVEKVALLGRRTAEMHLSLCRSNCHNSDFAPESFTDAYCKLMTERLIERLERCFSQLQTSSLSTTKIVLDSKKILFDFIIGFRSRSFQSLRIRIHGDFHLGQILFNEANNDFIILDFEGEPSNNTFERHLKHSPWKDVAGMIRSFHYVSTLTQNHWFEYVSDVFIQSYLKHSSPLCIDQSESNDLFLFHLLERSVYELNYEMNYRAQWVKIPLCGLVEVIHKIEQRQRCQ